MGRATTARNSLRLWHLWRLWRLPRLEHRPHLLRPEVGHERDHDAGECERDCGGGGGGGGAAGSRDGAAPFRETTLRSPGTWAVEEEPYLPTRRVS